VGLPGLTGRGGVGRLVVRGIVEKRVVGLGLVGWGGGGGRVMGRLGDGGRVGGRREGGGGLTVVDGPSVK